MKKLNLIIIAMLLLLTACTSAPIKENREVTIITNVQEAELFLDGKSLGVINAGFKVINVPISGIHLIRLQRDNDISDFTITDKFKNKPIELNFTTLKNKPKSVENTNDSSYNELNTEVKNMKLKNEIKQELELERTKERVLKMESQK